MRRAKRLALMLAMVAAGAVVGAKVISAGDDKSVPRGRMIVPNTWTIVSITPMMGGGNGIPFTVVVAKDEKGFTHMLWYRGWKGDMKPESHVVVDSQPLNVVFD